MRDLYEVSTPAIEHLRELVLGDSAVLGARLMGGGFGGNVLALIAETDTPALLEHVQTVFYARQGRNAWQEGAVMISTAGAGLTELMG